jgi:hypothetical protein
LSARLSTAIKIAKASRGILRKTRRLADQGLEAAQEDGEFALDGVEPMLLSLSMELALKAWFVFDFDDPKTPKTHNLAKLFDKLTVESQGKLDAEFKRSIAPRHPNLLYVDYGIRNLLYQHKDAFVDWRYLHEPKSMMFDQSAFEATLEMVLEEFEKRYCSERVEPMWGWRIAPHRID